MQNRKFYYFRVSPIEKHRMINIKAFSIFQILSHFGVSREDYREKIKLGELKILRTKTLSSKIEIDLTNGFKNKATNKRKRTSRLELTRIPISTRGKNNINKSCKFIIKKNIGDITDRTFYYCTNEQVIEKFKKYKDENCILIMRCCALKN